MNLDKLCRRSPWDNFVFTLVSYRDELEVSEGIEDLRPHRFHFRLRKSSKVRGVLVRERRKERKKGEREYIRSELVIVRG